MARKDLVKYKLSPEDEAILLDILERAGSIASPNYLAEEVLGVQPRAVANFLKTKRAKDAAARANPHSRSGLLDELGERIRENPQEHVLTSDDLPEGTHFIEEIIPAEMCSTLRLVSRDVK